LKQGDGIAVVCNSTSGETPVESIEKAGLKRVYDISVEGNENFVTKDGVVLHNTAKSLFVMEISRLPNSRYALGSSSSKAGIVDFLLEQRPRYLIVDEIERMTSEDQSALLSLMESGIVTRLKKGMREKIKLNTLVFATCNRPERLPPELRSRFLTLHFREYSPDDFRRVVAGVLTRREGVDPELAAYIADRLAGRTRDVRDAVRVARLCNSREEVDAMIGIMEEYKG
jgi:Holliday junction DNA helicase RuvB